DGGATALAQIRKGRFPLADRRGDLDVLRLSTDAAEGVGGGATEIAKILTRLCGRNPDLAQRTGGLFEGVDELADALLGVSQAFGNIVRALQLDAGRDRVVGGHLLQMFLEQGLELTGGAGDGAQDVETLAQIDAPHSDEQWHHLAADAPAEQRRLIAGTAEAHEPAELSRIGLRGPAPAAGADREISIDRQPERALDRAAGL